ncbi:hypothetical protein MANI_012519 [Metarhizium anisopliae]|nr:hypothetical protein MANI_012519 [Metarhizium anisopliae]
MSRQASGPAPATSNSSSGPSFRVTPPMAIAFNTSPSPPSSGGSASAHWATNHHRRRTASSLAVELAAANFLSDSIAEPPWDNLRTMPPILFADRRCRRPGQRSLRLDIQ